MPRDLIILLTAALSTLGFSILFYVHPRRLILATLGGVLTCGAYLVAGHFIDGVFIPNLIGATVGAAYAEVIARSTRVPVPVYMIPGMIPLAPGGALYNTMFNLVSGEFSAAGDAGMTTLKIALGIAGGIMAASVVGLFIHPRKRARQVPNP